MEEKQDIEIKEHLDRIEKQLKINQVCLFVLLGWVVFMSAAPGSVFTNLVSKIVAGFTILAVIVLAFIWGIAYYQDWKLNKEKVGRG